MAIRLEVEPYCQDCPEFEVDVQSPTSYYSNHELYMRTGDTVIRCKNKAVCNRIKEHLEKNME